MALAARNVSADDARMMGLVHEIHPGDELMSRVYAFAAELANIDAETVALAKLVIDASDPQDREKVRQLERVANTPLVHMGVGRPARDHVPPGRK
jgi:enoyl-CoA hydratase/carnithine racemase